MDDSQILTLYESRDPQAISETQHTYGAYCGGIVSSILEDQRDTEEVLADTWLQTWNSIPPQKPACLRLYLAKIARNLAISRWRSQRAEKRGGGQTEIALEELMLCIPGKDQTESYVNLRELEETINRFLYDQPERDRNIFLRRYFYMDSAQKIGIRYGLKTSNVLQILSRTRKKLKRKLIQEGYDL